VPREQREFSHASHVADGGGFHPLGDWLRAAYGHSNRPGEGQLFTHGLQRLGCPEACTAGSGVPKSGGRAAHAWIRYWVSPVSLEYLQQCLEGVIHGQTAVVRYEGWHSVAGTGELYWVPRVGAGVVSSEILTASRPSSVSDATTFVAWLGEQRAVY